MSTTTTATAKSAVKSSAKMDARLALVHKPTDGGNALMNIQTKTAKGLRLLSKWEFRSINNLSRTELATKWPAYVAEESKKMNSMLAGLLAAGKVHVTGSSGTAKGSLTIKALSSLPTVEAVKETKVEKKVMAVSDAAAAIGLPVALLTALKGLTPAQLAAIMGTAAPAAPVAAPAAPTATLDDVLAAAKAEAVTAEPAH